MEIYLDANSTTAVLPQALNAAIEAMSDVFGNPASAHAAGVRARRVVESTRQKLRRMLGVPTGQLIFTSGASEAVHTAVLSAMLSIQGARDRGDHGLDLLLHGATEHKVVVEALQHWNSVLRLRMKVIAIPVGQDGRHDLDWLTKHAHRAGLVCTMAVNNETGVISDLDGIQFALERTRALWLIDAVQALGKLSLRLHERPADYVAFSGHKLCAPKGIGLLYVREGAPLTPLMAGSGKEGALRSGTDNLPGIAALGAVVDLFSSGDHYVPPAILETHRARLMEALRAAFPGVVFNADPAKTIPTTISFSVPLAPPKLITELFEAASMQVSRGAAYGYPYAPNEVLRAMGIAMWRCETAIRISFAPHISSEVIQMACDRILKIGKSMEVLLKASESLPTASPGRTTEHERG